MPVYGLQLIGFDPRITTVVANASVFHGHHTIEPAMVFLVDEREEVGVGVSVDPSWEISRLVDRAALAPRAEWMVDAAGFVVVTGVTLAHAGISDDAACWHSSWRADRLPAVAVGRRTRVVAASAGLSYLPIVPAAERPDGSGEPLFLELAGDIGRAIGCRARDIIPEIEACGDASIILEIASDGGRLDEGRAIYDALARHPFAVRANITRAHSAAALVALAADVRTIDGTVLVHQPYLDATDEKFEVADLLSASRRLLTSLAGIVRTVAARTGSDYATAERWIMDETTFGAGDAITHGFAHAVNDRRAPRSGPARRARFAPINGPFRSAPVAKAFEYGGRYLRGARVRHQDKVWVARRDCLAAVGLEPHTSSDWRAA